MPDFLLHLTGLADCVGDFFTKQFSIAAAQPVNGHVHGPDANAAAGGQFRTLSGSLLTGESFLEQIEEVAFGCFSRA